MQLKKLLAEPNAAIPANREGAPTMNPRTSEATIATAAALLNAHSRRV
jgi:hypothetical protein